MSSQSCGCDLEAGWVCETHREMARAATVDLLHTQLELEELMRDTVPAFTEEVRVTDPVTGGAKGRKQCQLGAVDPDALGWVGRVAGYGGGKYARYNFAKGYQWSLSYDALQRHLMAFWNGEDLDPESRLPHLAHAAWHCLALMTFSLRHRGTDDRFPI